MPINNIIIIGATGKQNKTVRKQVSLELNSQNFTIPIVFLVASGLPFNMLIGCDVLRQHSAIINLQQGIVFLTSERGIWSAKIINCNPTPTALNQDPVLKNYYCRNHEPSMIINDEEDNSELWEKKLEEIRIFERNRPNQEISKTQVENLIKIYQKYQHIFSNTPGKMCIRDRCSCCTFCVNVMF